MALPPSSGDEAWLLTSAALVFLMVPALSLFYGGMVARSAVLHTVSLSAAAAAAGSLFWSLIGYSLAFGPAGAGATGPWPAWGGLACVCRRVRSGARGRGCGCTAQQQQQLRQTASHRNATGGRSRSG